MDRIDKVRFPEATTSFDVEIRQARGRVRVRRSGKIAYGQYQSLRAGARPMRRLLLLEAAPVERENDFYGKFRCALVAPTE